MGEMLERVQSCLACVRKKTDFKPRVALVLGSGLGNFAEQIRIADTLAYSEIDGFPRSTVAGHEGRFVFGYVEETPVVIMQGRVHYYEGYTMEEVVLPVRLMQAMGAEKLFLTNAAGGIGDGFQCGDLMMITDHISCFVPNPLLGKNEEKFGVRFPDMSAIYDKELQEMLRQCGKRLNIPLKEGVYLQLTGPSYETPAEIKMCKLLGASAVGMSTAVEAVAANHLGMKICGISFISNLAAGIQKTPLCHEEVKAAADEAAPKFQALVKLAVSMM
ncbi:MAG: purine-nucleoside phosphorylase [Bacteroidales bacterium]|nr:purine-nucleoside phosphorylase [Clostridium sp.]MCM1203023.1 purine-nucleoside phosphorylase [Bacteroidales bacterium]